MNKLVFLIITLFSINIHLKAQFSLQTEIRPRGEYRHGYKSLFSNDDNDAYFVSQRTRLGLNYKDEKFSIKITAQDVRVWEMKVFTTLQRLKVMPQV